MDADNYVILKDNILTKEITYEKNIKEKTFNISSKTQKDDK